MIRRALFVTSILLILFWISGAYYIKHRLTSSLDELSNNNMSLTYKDTSIGGFPFSWKINVSEPKVTLTTQSSVRELDLKKISFCFDYRLKKIRVNFPKIVEYNFSQAGIEHSYSINGDDDISLNIEFAESLYGLDDIVSVGYVKNIDFNIPHLKVLSNNHDIIHLSNINLFSSHDTEGEVTSNKLVVGAEYKSEKNDSYITLASILVDLDHVISNIPDGSSFQTNHALNINQLSFIFDESMLGVNGNLNLSKNSMPVGKLSVKMKKYHDIIDILVPESFLLSKSDLKKLVAKAVMADLNKVASNEDKINLDIILSDKGIIVGNLQLVDLLK